MQLIPTPTSWRRLTVLGFVTLLLGLSLFSKGSYGLNRPVGVEPEIWSRLVELEARVDFLESRGRTVSAYEAAENLVRADVEASESQGSEDVANLLRGRAVSHVFRLVLLASVAGTPEKAAQLLSQTTKGLPEGWFRGRLELELHSLVKRCANSGIDAAEVESLERRSGFVTEWRIIGPFENERGGGYGRTFPPETEFDPDGSYDGKARSVRWRSIPVPVRDVVDFSAFLSPRIQGLAYALTSVFVPETREVAIRVGSDDGIKIWVNDSLVHAKQVRRPLRLDQDVVGVQLQKGWNKVLVKVTQLEDQWGFALRLTTPAGGPSEGLSFDASPDHLASLSYPVGVAPGVEVSKGAIDHLEEAVTDHELAALHLDLSFLYQLLRPEDDVAMVAYRHARRAREIDPSSLRAVFASAVTSELRAEMRPEVEENKKRLLLEEVVRRDPGHVQALLMLTRYYTSSIDSPQKSWDFLRQAIEASTRDSDQPSDSVEDLGPLASHLPSPAPDVNLQVVAWLRRRGMGAQADGFSREVLDGGGSDLRSPKMVIERAETAVRAGKIENALDEYRSLYDSNLTDPSIRGRLIELLRESGRAEEAVVILREAVASNPSDLPSRIMAARILEGIEEFSAALNLRREVVRINPDSAPASAALARLLHRLDRTEEAREMFQRVLELDANDFKTRRYLDFLQDSDREFHKEFPVDLGPHLTYADSVEQQLNEPYSYILRRTLIRLNRDGRASRYYQVLVKILNDRGIREFDIYPIAFAPEEQQVRVLTNRVHHRDGSKTEGSTRRQSTRDRRRSRDERRFQNQYVDFPPLVVGDVVEVVYRLDDRRQSFFGDYFGDTFAFQETDLIPVGASTLILVAPPDRELFFHRLHGAPEGQLLKRTDEEVVWRWEMTGLSGIEREAFMPPGGEIVPSVQVTTYETWDDFAQWWWNLIRKEGQSSPDLERVVRDLGEPTQPRGELIPRFYDFVVSDIRYVAWEFGVHGYKPYNSSTILARRFGDCKDKAILLNTMLGGVGVDAYPALVFSGNPPRRQDLTLPMVSHFNHCISYVPGDDGNGLFLDGTTDVHGSKNLPGGDRARLALVVNNGRAEVIPIPEFRPEENASVHQLRIELAAGDRARVSGRFEARGDLGASARRQYQNPDRSADVIAGAYTNRFGPTSILDCRFSDMEDLEAPVSYEVDAMVEGIVVPSGPHLTVSAVQFPVDLSQYGGTETRRFDVLLPPPSQRVEEVTFVIPSELRLSEMPEGLSLEEPFGSYELKFEWVGDHEISVRRDLRLATRRVAASDYPAFREFCLLVAQAEGRRLRLVAAE